MAIYYVSKDGNDSWDGLAPAYVSGTNGPWLTIAKVNTSGVMNALADGDSVLFNRGNTWAVGTGAALKITKTGLTAYVTFGAYGTGAKPIITHDSSSDGLGCIGPGYTDNVNYIRVDNFDVTLTGTASAIQFYRVGANIWISNCDVVASTAGANGIYLDEINTYLIEGCDVLGYNSGIVIYGSAANKITNGVIQNNDCHGATGNDGITVHYDGSSNPTGPNHQILNNRCYDNKEQGIDCYGSGDNILIEGNETWGNDGGSIIVGTGGAAIANYTINKHWSHDDGVGSGGHAINISNCLSCTIKYSIIRNPSGCVFTTQNAPTYIYFYNNTVVMGATFAGSGAIDINSGANYIYIKNNIFHSDSADKPVYWVRYLGGATPTNTNSAWDYNVYNIPSNSDNRDWYDGSAALLLADWRSTWTQDVNSQGNAVDPLLVNGGGSYALETDFTLQSGSPCIKAGTNVGLDEDYGGTWVFGPIDIGAYAYTGETIRMIVAK